MAPTVAVAKPITACMAHAVGMACILMAYWSWPYIVMAYIVMANIVMAHEPEAWLGEVERRLVIRAGVLAAASLHQVPDHGLGSGRRLRWVGGPASITGITAPLYYATAHCEWRVLEHFFKNKGPCIPWYTAYVVMALSSMFWYTAHCTRNAVCCVPCSPCTVCLSGRNAAATPFGTRPRKPMVSASADDI